jgi:hypothetical protein
MVFAVYLSIGVLFTIMLFLVHNKYFNNGSFTNGLLDYIVSIGAWPLILIGFIAVTLDAWRDSKKK